jgi:hypothetical protein
MDLEPLRLNLTLAQEQIDLLKTGRRVAATRARDDLLKIKKYVDVLRKEIMLYSKEMPKKEKKTVKVVEHVEPEPEKPVAEPEKKLPKKKPRKAAASAKITAIEPTPTPEPTTTDGN